MFFSLSKIFWLLAAPSHVLALLVLACALCLLLRRYRAGRWMGLLAALVLILAGVLPLHVGLMRALEDRYPRPGWPAHVDGVLTLSGGLDTAMLRARKVTAQEGSETRLVAAFELARRYPGARIVFTGGSNALGGSALSESETAKYVFNQLGLPPARLTFETRSRNTYENILLTRRMVQPLPGEVWLLATSAMQMPRAMEIAHKQGWKLVPWPTDYLTLPQGGGGLFNIAGNLAATDYAVHEWIGLWAYRLAGKSSRP